MKPSSPLFLFVVAVVAAAAVAFVVINRSDDLASPGALHEVDGFPVIALTGAIDARLARRTARSLRDLERRGARDVVVVLNSPGGSVASTLELADMFNATRVTTHGLLGDAVAAAAQLVPTMDHVYCLPSAIISGSHMASASGPVDPMVARIYREMADQMKSAAKANGHDEEIFAALADPRVELKRDGTAVKPAGELLTLTAKEALAWGISRGTFASPEALIAHLKSHVDPAAP